MYKKCENCYKDGKTPDEESCKKCENDLKAKKQECEFSNLKIIQLQETLKQYEEENTELKNQRDQWISRCEQETKTKEFFEDRLKEIELELDQLKTKNFILEDEYKILEDNLDSRTRDFEDVIDSYKQTLAKIKKIASKVLLNTHDLEQFKDADSLFGALLEIHKKISEVIE